MLFLQDISNRLNDEGILVLTSPYTWQESSTKKEFWLGGYRDADGQEIRTLQTLKKVLNERFELLHVENIPFIIKESARKYQHTIAEMSVWKKR